jgi:hypothetical protein
VGTPGLTVIPDKWSRPVRRLADLIVGPTDLVGGPHDLLKTFKKIPHDLIRNDLKTWRARQDIGRFRPSRSTDMTSVVIN